MRNTLNRKRCSDIDAQRDESGCLLSECEVLLRVHYVRVLGVYEVEPITTRLHLDMPEISELTNPRSPSAGARGRACLVWLSFHEGFSAASGTFVFGPLRSYCRHRLNYSAT